MYGAILGDMIGAPYEFDRGDKTKDFILFNPKESIRYTDDTVMTLAIAKAIMQVGADAGELPLKREFVRCMQDLGRRYAQGEYGGRFAVWLRSPDPKPYGSYGNGSAMRVSAIGWAFEFIERTREVARYSAEVTHDHPEGIKGAESVASAIYLARTGAGKAEIRDYVSEYFGYDLSRTCDEIRPTYHHVESCQETVPQAFAAFFEGTGFEDVIRTAVSLGGDCDTLTAIAGSIAEAFYGVPENFKKEAESRLDPELLGILKDFESAGFYSQKRTSIEADFRP
ncbi:MAG: ADP-ribosylglycohydrolase family protein [Lachnospiraceae bacterium]|nr:ADP-ribosylglycohydrolase family protein [Lachnospiraceae bacterium]